MNTRRRHIRGMSLLYMSVFLSVAFGFASLAVDYGRVVLARTELRAAADAAGRAAAGNIEMGRTAARNAAVAMAAQNFADGAPVALDPSEDIQFVNWDATSRTFTVLSGFAESDGNAILITARHTAARGNPIKLIFGPAIGARTCDVTATSIVSLDNPGPGIVGLDSINLADKKTNSYSSKTTPTPSTFDNHGSIFSNGTITLKSGVVINGDARPGTNGNVKMDSSCTVTGTTAPLTYTLVYPMPDGSAYATNNDNNQFGPYYRGSSISVSGNAHLSLPGGNYYVNDFSVSSNAVISFQGPATIWCSGTFSCSGGITTCDNIPANLKVRMISGGRRSSATFSGGSGIYCDYYGPQSSLSITGGGDFYGRIIAGSLNVGGSGELHYDQSLSSQAGSLAIVK